MTHPLAAKDFLPNVTARKIISSDMRKFLYFFLISIILFPVSMLAQDDDTKRVYYLEDNTCDPKPYIRFRVNPNATDFYYISSKGNKVSYTRSTLRQKITGFTYQEEGSEEVKLLPNTKYFTDFNKESGEIILFVYDNLYLPAKAKVKVTMPTLFAVYEDGDTLEYQSETFDLKVNDAVYVTSSCNSSDVTVAPDQTLIVKKSQVLTVNSDLNVANLIVEAGDSTNLAGGVVVEKGCSLAVADTAYFLCHNKYPRNNPYLINRGDYSAAASIFTKSVDHRINLAYAKKYGYLKDGKLQLVDEAAPTISFPVEKPDENFAFIASTKPLLINQQNLAFWAPDKDAFRYYYNIGTPKLTEDKYPEAQKDLNTWNAITKDETIFRAKGDINDQSEYSQRLIKEYDQFTTTFSVLQNPYQAAIDWTKLIADQPELRDELRCVTIGSGRHNISWDYNFYTGLTTYDGPMQYGVLQPVMEPARLYQLGKTTGTTVKDEETQVRDDIYVRVRKDYLTSYNRVDTLSSNVSVPYIRFYVENPDCPKGVGNRSIYVVYFIPFDEYDSFYTDDNQFFNPFLGTNKLLDVHAHRENPYAENITCFGARPYCPYVGYRKFLDSFGRIKAYPLPDLGNEIYFDKSFMVIAMERNQESVELGVLDYGNFNGLSFKCGSIVINGLDESKNVTKVLLSQGNAEENGFSYSNASSHLFNNYPVAYMSVKTDNASLKNISYKPTSISDSLSDQKPNALISSDDLTIIVQTEESSNVRIYNLFGALIESADVYGSKSFTVEKGIYIVNVTNKQGNSSSKVLVH